MSTMNRRAVLAGAAALPASTLHDASRPADADGARRPGRIREHEAWFREDTEVIDFFAPPRDDFLLGGKPAYMSEG